MHAAEGRWEPGGTFQQSAKQQQQQWQAVCACLTALISIDHATDSGADVGGGGGAGCDCHGVLCPRTDIHHISLWIQWNVDTLVTITKFGGGVSLKSALCSAVVKINMCEFSLLPTCKT